jgi:hypothetical protein
MIENAGFFIDACKAIGVNEMVLFNPNDLVDRKCVIELTVIYVNEYI